mmetsp:Transcript_12866/g.38822  ORF Transcript_12866/g.38822 Transcript_12866/m.38822 type:complete len:260 (+) Transcript_12866:2498-3277(+)
MRGEREDDSSGSMDDPPSFLRSFFEVSPGSGKEGAPKLSEKATLPSPSSSSEPERGAGGTTRARPKSQTLRVPSACNKRLAGLMSRWMMSEACMKATAVSNSRSSRRASGNVKNTSIFVNCRKSVRHASKKRYKSRLCRELDALGVVQPYSDTTPSTARRRRRISNSRTNRREISHDSMSTSRMTFTAHATSRLLGDSSPFSSAPRCCCWCAVVEKPNALSELSEFLLPFRWKSPLAVAPRLCTNILFSPTHVASNTLA